MCALTSQRVQFPTELKFADWIKNHVYFLSGEAKSSPPFAEFLLRPLHKTSRLVLRESEIGFAWPVASRQDAERAA
jgi:hypothetical protein